MPRYEFTDDTSNKFWEIELDGSEFTTKWGRIGTDGQSKTKSWASPEQAKREYDKLVASKVKDGYELVDGDGDGDDDSDGDEGESASNPELEALIEKNLDDPQPYAVYADWLQAQGDPRGELISLQLATAKAPNAEQTKRANAIISEQAETFWGEELSEQLESESLSAEWRNGFVHKLFVGQKDFDESVDPGELLGKALQRPVCRFVREVVIGVSDLESGEAHPGTAIEVLVKRKPKTVTSLFAMEFDYPDETEMSWTSLGDVSALWAVMPQLEEVKLRSGSGVTLGKLNLPNAKSFTIETGGLAKENFESIATAAWPKLERLEVWFGSDNYGATCELDQVRAFLWRTDLPTLKHLGLKNAEFTDALIEVLAASPMLKQLETLDLSMGCMTDVGAGALLTHKAAFAHLQSLDVSDNGIGDLLLDLKTVAKHVEHGGQREFDEDYRYTAVGE